MKIIKATQLKNTTENREKNKIDRDSFRKDKKTIKNNKLILKTKHRLESEIHNFFLKNSIRLF